MKNKTFLIIRTKIKTAFCLILFCSTTIVKCKFSLEVPAPTTSTNSENVYKDDLTASSVLTGIYAQLSNTFTSGSVASITLYGGLSADELTLYDLTNTNYIDYYKNSLNPTTASNTVHWNQIYTLLYRCNAAIEGLTTSSNVSELVRNQLLGEAKFMRSFLNFYLINLYGDAPLVTSTDYKKNSGLQRTPTSEIYMQIKKDLMEAKSLLSENFMSSNLTTTTTERIRPNKGAAQALLARVYLYTKDYVNAEIESTGVIQNKSMYDTATIGNVFLKNSKETIWAIQPVITGRNTDDAFLFILPSTGPNSTKPVYLSDSVVNAFENSDKRKSIWTGKASTSLQTFYYPAKYKVGNANQPVTEYTIALRIAEQYLIRAEAKAYQNKITESLADLNLIRSRAGLGSINITNQTELINSIYHERQVEFFAEWAHRWLDLKRTNRADKIMPIITQKKGGQWKSEWQFYPISTTELLQNPNLTQTPGYQN